MYPTPPSLPPTGLRRWWRDLWRLSTPRRQDWLHLGAVLVFSAVFNSSYPFLAFDRLGAWGVFLVLLGLVSRSAAAVVPPTWHALAGILRLLHLLASGMGVVLCLLEALI